MYTGKFLMILARDFHNFFVLLSKMPLKFADFPIQQGKFATGSQLLLVG